MKRVFVVLLPALLVLSGCYRGHGLDPVSGGADVAGIGGHVTFTGTWPDSTREVRVAVMKHYPEGVSDPDSLLGFVLNAFSSGELFFSDTLPRFSTNCDYELALEPGNYEWVLVVWFPDIANYLLGVKELGGYSKEAGQTHSSVAVIPGSITPGIDIDADFTNVYRDTPFYKREERP
jgi:hypothetical protein